MPIYQVEFYDGDYKTRQQEAKAILLAITAPITDRRIRVMKGGQQLVSEVIDEDAELVWVPVRLLQIAEQDT